MEEIGPSSQAIAIKKRISKEQVSFIVARELKEVHGSNIRLVMSRINGPNH